MNDYTEELDELDELELLKEQQEMANVPPPVSTTADPAIPMDMQMDVPQERIDEIYSRRDSDNSIQNILQGITGLSAGLASQGRVRPDTSVFDAVRAAANERAKNEIAVEQNKSKRVADFLKSKLASKNADRDYKLRERGIRAQEQANASRVASANQKQQEALKSKELQQQTRDRDAQVAIDTATEALDILQNSRNPTTGWLGYGLGALSPSSDAGVLRQKIDSLKGLIGLNKLLELKAAGGTLGALNKEELGMLQNSMGVLEAGGSKEELEKNLKRVVFLLNKSRGIKEGFEKRTLFKEMPDGKRVRAVVNSDQELKEAMAEGFQ